MKIISKTIKHKDQRYDTIGDWFFKNKTLHIKVSDMNDVRYEFLVSIHEQIEAFLCRCNGVKESDVTDFDQRYEEERNKYSMNLEPGDSPQAPYKKEHFFATSIERLIAHELGVDWNEYDKAVNEL